MWQDGQWIDVIIDDYLPTRHGKLIYTKSALENVFWSALLEKACAKHHGSYDSLHGGSSCEAMVDFSGGCTEMKKLGTDEQEWDEIYNFMNKCCERCTMIACHVDPDPDISQSAADLGLIQGHAYSVTKAVTIKRPNEQEIRLVRVRNPWGNEVKWMGQWSDGSEEWKVIADDDKEKLGLNYENDGEFYMSHRDFMKHFEMIEMTHLAPDYIDDQIEHENLQWNLQCFHGSWIQRKNAGGCRNHLETFTKNPQYVVCYRECDSAQDDSCVCIISLLQKGTRRKRSQNLIDDVEDKAVNFLTIGESYPSYSYKIPNTF
jgi:calpain